ncbi:hypothetical protein Zmor_001988 [Zophobas morio]|uniref:Uncharacterized protein n=1 Tax=Zophobas morio TaxID=2755281 RepID=A0AA38J342_9CUCU|nr:hypothetical protein Zmor_001988 [Zophobas morio]
MDKTLFLTGHGCSGTYLKRTGKRDGDKCQHCGDKDDLDHIVLKCPRYSEQSKDLPWHSITGEQMIAQMLQNTHSWEKIKELVKDIPSTKKRQTKE